MEEDMDYEDMQNVLNLIKKGQLECIRQFIWQYNETTLSELIHIKNF